MASWPSDSSQSLRSSRYAQSSSTTRIRCFIPLSFGETGPHASNRVPKLAHHYGHTIVLTELNLQSNYSARGWKAATHVEHRYAVRARQANGMLPLKSL